MTPNHVKRKLRSGTGSVGSWLNLGSPTSAESMAALGFDWLCVDMEHGQIDLSTPAAMLAAVGRRRANEEILVVAQIEHVDAVGKIDDILSVPGLDACYTGPNDLCASRGMTPSTEPDPEFETMMQALLAAARRRGVAPGIHCATPAYANRRLAEGWKLVGVANDLRFLTAAATAAREAIRA
jgi:2-keto-3-deoxy-L-rhamnonate aldolase RhmA